mmetsp:Transcript_10929/g.25164  ORF Transcript_10929/g.25164 Transcript_10929/m.25164 type:complete len:277 (-) Transcript_10929:549-1379(-)
MPCLSRLQPHPTLVESPQLDLKDQPCHGRNAGRYHHPPTSAILIPQAQWSLTLRTARLPPGVLPSSPCCGVSSSEGAASSSDADGASPPENKRAGRGLMTERTEAGVGGKVVSGDGKLITCARRGVPISIWGGPPALVVVGRAGLAAGVLSVGGHAACSISIHRLRCAAVLLQRRCRRPLAAECRWKVKLEGASLQSDDSWTREAHSTITGVSAMTPTGKSKCDGACAAWGLESATAGDVADPAPKKDCGSDPFGVPRGVPPSSLSISSISECASV